ncbi:MAG: DNA-3-methyladenine glycosylase [Sphingobacteriales bacterium]|jgi:DNA-3-methyladenine glycosylase|nr:MAG: DNA-3-methyladenine glycosylase [Sphingobacteriales bacterium]
MKKISASFYLQENVVQLAQQLIGKLLVTRFEEGTTIGRIVETEAYNGIIDKASHAYNNRRTSRTEVMFANGGVAYVYLCYGIHHLFNVVTNQQNVPHAILIRGIEPVTGLSIMQHRMNKKTTDFSIGRGPGNVSRALGLHTRHSGTSLLKNTLYLATDNFTIDPLLIKSGPRIGVAYAAEDALLPYRFYIKNNRYVSGKNT